MVIQTFRHACHMAYHGSGEWLLQRLTALIMAVYSLTLGGLLLLKQPAGFEAWHALFAQGWLRVATALFLFSLYIHAWQGVGDILNDYIKPLAVRRVLRWAVTISLIVYAVWTVRILWSV